MYAVHAYAILRLFLLSLRLSIFLVDSLDTRVCLRFSTSLGQIWLFVSPCSVILLHIATSKCLAVSLLTVAATETAAAAAPVRLQQQIDAFECCRRSVEHLIQYLEDVKSGTRLCICALRGACIGTARGVFEDQHISIYPLKEQLYGYIVMRWRVLRAFYCMPVNTVGRACLLRRYPAIGIDAPARFVQPHLQQKRHCKLLWKRL